MKLTVLPLARADLEQITEHGIENFGEKQARLYLKGLFNTLNTVTKFPNIGRICIENDEYRRFSYHQHIIFYRSENDRIIISRILNGRMNIKRHI